MEQHKGCDILDINPGACLWSQKLHDFLQPRSHVLLEPNPEIFKAFLGPLLNAPDSKYKLVEKDPLALPSYREIVDEGVFPNQTRVDPADPKCQDLNDSLLVTGYFVWDPKLPGLAFDSMAKQLLHHFASAAWSNDLFHAYGPVRMLLWMQTEDFNPMIAQGSTALSRGNQLLEMTHDLNMIVRAERTHRPLGRGGGGREPQYELESMIRALREGKRHGMKIPSRRRDYSYGFAKDIEKVSRGTGISSVDWLHEYTYKQALKGIKPTGLLAASTVKNYEEEKRLKIEYPDFKVAPMLGPPPRRVNKSESTLVCDQPDEKRYQEFVTDRRSARHTHKVRKLIEEAADVGEELYRLEREALKMPEGPERQMLNERIEDQDRAFEQALEGVPANYQAPVDAEIDDRIVLRHSQQPRIQWDQRPFEPLVSWEEEVWPRNRLSLVYTSPKPKIVGEGEDWSEWVLDFVHALYADSNRPIAVALDTMQHGLQDIIKGCSSLSDPDKGGRLQMKHLRVRMLTTDMIYELVTAYKEWPFKAPGTDHKRYFRHKTSTIN